jgi:hypothetical protein
MPPAELQVITFLLSLGNLVFFLFALGRGTLLLSGTVLSAEPLFLGEGSLLVPEYSKAWKLSIISVCGGRLLALLCSKLKVPVEQQSQET